MPEDDRWPIEADFDLVEAQPWDRQPNEPAAAYESFRAFRDLSPSRRTGAGAVAESVGMSDRQCRAWAAQWDWWQRAEAWDEAQYRIEDAERLDAIRQMHAVHRRAGRVALTKALQALNTMQPETMTPSQVARLLELGARLERTTLIVSVEELQGIEEEDEEQGEDPWSAIAAELTAPEPEDAAG